ncbi:MAG: sugar phosphate nucleotidyltransferase, partial [Patescibacteria group bacterium]
MKKKIRKAVIPAAGFGTRFLPQTKAMPKEMLPIVDKPVIQYVVEEAVASGIEDIVIVTGSMKRAIEDHFDTPNAELMQNLEASGKQEMIDEIKRISDMANFIYMRQKG